MNKVNKWLIGKIEYLTTFLDELNLESFNNKFFKEEVFKRLNDRIRYHKVYYVWTGIFCLLGYSLFSYFIIQKSAPAALFMVAALLYDCFFGVPLTRPFFKIYIDFLFYLHRVLPDPDLRFAEIKAFHESYLINRENVQWNELVAIQHNRISFRKELVKEYLDNKNLFCRKYFRMKSASFVQYYDDRIINSTTGEINEDYLLYSLLIPKRLELSNDALRRCLQHYPELDLGISSPITSKVFVELSCKIDEMFKDYSPNQIERLFTNHQGKSYFYELGDHLSRVLPIAKNFQDLHSLLCERKLPSELQAINGATINEFNVKVLLTKLDYEHASIKFSNCVKSYVTRSDLHIVLFFANNLPEACVAIKNKEVEEIKGVGNSMFFREKQIIRILKEKEVIR